MKLFLKNERPDDSVYATIDKRNACQTFVCLPENDDSTVYIAFPARKSVENIVMSSMMMLSHILPEKQIERLKTIEFVNIHDALPQTEENGQDDAVYMEAERLHELVMNIANTQSAEQDKLWETLEAKDCVYTGLIPFLKENELSTIAYRKITHNLSTPQSLIEYIREKVSATYHVEESDVWVSSQVVTGRDALHSWNDFHTQAYDKLVCDTKYVRHIYDVQTQEAGQPIVPIYGFFLGVHKRWPRRILWNDFCRFANAIALLPFTEKIDMIPYFKEISTDSMPILPKVYDIASFQHFYTEYAETMDAVCRNEYVPGAGNEKDKAGGVWSFVKKTFLRKK